MKAARPTVLFSGEVPVAPLGKVVRVGRGTTFTVRTDAQNVSDIGAVTYPLAYVRTGSAEKDAPREMGVPFSRVSPETFTADEDEVTLSADEVDTTVWLYTFEERGTPGGCGCGGSCGCKR